MVRHDEMIILGKAIQKALLKNGSKKEGVCRVFSEDRDIKLAKDLICLHFTPTSQVFEMYINGETLIGQGINDMVDCLNLLYDLNARRIRDAGKKASSRIIVFTSILTILTPIIEKFFEKESSCESECAEGYKRCYEILTTKIHFRNFSTIVNESLDVLRKKHPDLTATEVMARYIKDFDSPTTRVRYSLAHMTQKEFYKPILSEVRHERGNTNFATKKLYDDLLLGNRAGAFRKFYDGHPVCWKLLRDVVSYDKKSAYPSVFVGNNKFGLGKLTLYSGNKLKHLDRAVRDGDWFKIVIETDQDLGPYFSLFQQRGTAYKYGIDLADYRTVENYGLIDHFLRWLHDNDDCWAIIKSQDTGYMPLSIRKRIIELYDLKNSIKDKDDPQRVKAKTMLDMLYGKGIQQRPYTDIKEITRYYFTHSDAAILPHQSMHALASVRSEILWVIDNCRADVYAYDTDGLKLSDEDDIIDRVNEIILKNNRAAGFPDCDIGMWEKEYVAKRFVQFKTKCYVYDDGDKITWKLSSITPEEIEKFLKSIDDDPIEHLLRDGWTFNVFAGYRYDPLTMTYERTTLPHTFVNPNKNL